VIPDDPYDSPCVRECVLDLETGPQGALRGTNVCRGCGRTLHEIERWVDFTPEEREAIRARVAQRRPRGE
jgi:predicted Fe-S protein YdhL (DUF1289 family)